MGSKSPAVPAVALAVNLFCTQFLPAGDASADLPREQPGIDKLTPQQLLLYLSSEKELAAGVGFINAQLGDPLSSVIGIWGEPAASRKTGILGANEIMYQTDPNTLVVFTGRKVVKSISVKGRSASLLRTRKGARFGMAPVDIMRIYRGIETKTIRDRMEIRELGIDFHFRDNKVDKIVVYRPDT